VFAVIKVVSLKSNLPRLLFLGERGQFIVLREMKMIWPNDFISGIARLLRYVTSWTYDEFNRMVTQTDPLGHVTTHVYGISGGVSGNNPIAIIDPNNQTTTFGYDLEWQQTSVNDPLGNVTTYAYL
jgi:YD repeat-containing protein